jgi:hypothetical protein
MLKRLGMANYSLLMQKGSAAIIAALLMWL